MDCFNYAVLFQLVAILHLANFIALKFTGIFCRLNVNFSTDIIWTFTQLIMFTVKVSRSLYCFTICIFHGIKNYFLGL